ncbi:MAG: hypothetical protein LQ343_007878 [Gyalolechia ehrenbergii]|nr:MAG: hypothetical protein LQ343_007878 [Gyalolechia ehrenbergii]
MTSNSLPPPQEVYYLPLNDAGHPDVPGGYIYLPPPIEPAYIVRFAIEGTSSICREGALWVNVPKKGEKFNRHAFIEYKLYPDFNRTIYIDVPIHLAGAFAFYTTYTPLPSFTSTGTTPPKPTRTETFYFDVSPKLIVKAAILPINSLSIFSVISKLMGEYPKDWERHLGGIGQREYNMVHFTPLMQRGSSNSPYSIYDQLTFDPTCFPNGEDDVAAMIKSMENNHDLLGLTDVVWNHTANNSKWLEEHPEAGYNLETAPWLEAALELDNALLQYGTDLAKYGLPTELKSADDLQRVMDGMKPHCLDLVNVWEFYVVKVTRDAQAAVDAWMSGITSADSQVDGATDWSLGQRVDFLRSNALIGGDELAGRFHRRIDPYVAAALLTSIYGHGNPDRQQTARKAMMQWLNTLNVPYYQEYDADVSVIKQQVMDRVRYLRLDGNGPKLGPINKQHAFIESYFTRLPLNETTKKHNPRALFLVNNGWVWAADAMKDNAGSSSRTYLRREVIVWGDCVKLRYGKKPEDNPYLWDFMTRYTRLMAKYFAGFRIDNCHSTPLHVAEYLLDQARDVRPDLAVFAELFTGDEKMDYVFVKRLGLSALIREAMQAWSTREVSRLVHMHSGRPIGSFEIDRPSGGRKRTPSAVANGAVSLIAKSTEIVHDIRQSPVHALFMDCTHDNEMPAQKRDARDTLPNAALVNMCACATGSVMGYDEVYPRLIDLVSEPRLYHSSFSDHEVKVGAGRGGIGRIKKLLNQIHTFMGRHGYDETFIHHEGEYITVHRMQPKTRKGYFTVAHTAFPGYGDGHGTLTPVHLSGTKAKLVGSWNLDVNVSESAKQAVFDDKAFLRGLPSSVSDLPGVSLVVKEDETVIMMPSQFPPGSIAVFETWIPGAEHSEGLDQLVTTGATEAFSDSSLVDLNFIMYRSEPEERDTSGGKDGVYIVPGHGPLVYAGLQGWWSCLRDVVRYNQLGHPICNHLREGTWAMDYIVGRLDRMAKNKLYSSLLKPATWLSSRFDAIEQVPSFLRPRYFALAIQTAYDAAWARGMDLFNDDVQNGQAFVQSLAMISVQMTGYMHSASLDPFQSVPSMAAGLPHFSSSWARCWGRDIFISLRGLYLATGRYSDAYNHIMAFASVLKHGMIPNLLSDGKLPRYNSRDSIWFFLQTVHDYTKMAPNGLDLLKDKVQRRFLPYDDTYFDFDDPRAYSQESTIEEIVQEALQRHATGLSFREANAGPNLDMQMKDEAFNIDIRVDWNTGIIFGGNQSNCGTWMDKMGESVKAGSKGVPGTPRDGAPVEITGLLASTLLWVSGLHEKGAYRYEGVRTEAGDFVSFKAWASRLQESFERCYYVPKDPRDDSSYDVNSPIVNRRGIYKDLYKSGKEYEDYQLRPNFPIAMTVAPQLFTSDKALGALEMADKYLRGPTGMATLDPSDLNYRPYYVNSEDSNDFSTSKGRNYHQGPEWIWPTGFFLRALLKFDLLRKSSKAERTEAFQQITRRLEGCKIAIRESPWAGLPELTQKNGEFCGDSSPTQAWSAGGLLDLFYDAKVLANE